MFLIFIIELFRVSMILVSVNYTCTGGHSKEYDFMVISNDYWNTWKCSNIDKNYSTDVGMFCSHAEGIGKCAIDYCQKRREEVENLRGKEGTVKITAKTINSTVEDNPTETVSVQVFDEAIEGTEVCKFKSFREFSKTTIKASYQDHVQSCRAECQVIIEKKGHENYDDSLTSYEFVKEQYVQIGDDVKMNQSFLQATCKYECDKIEDRRNDISDYQDIHKGKNQPLEFGEILISVEKHKKQSYRAKESEARNGAFTSTANQEWLKKNPDSDINLPFRDPGLSEEKDKISVYFQEHRKWTESQMSISGVQQEFTPVTNTEGSPLIVTEEPYDSPSLKYKEISDENSDHSLIIVDRCSDFISLESDKKKALYSELLFRNTENTSGFVSLKSSKKKAEVITDLKEGVKLQSCRRHVVSSSVRTFFETGNKNLHKVKDASKIEQHILSDIDVTVQKKKCEVEIDDRTVRDIDLQKKRKYNLRQIVWLPRNWLPLPRLGMDAIVGFFEKQIRDGHDRSTLPPCEHGELKEMLRQLASDNVPGPQITMKYEMLRLCTMKTFPGQDRPFATRIIGAGFYYAGHLDQVICYCCGSRKDSWVLGDIPLLIHQKLAPDCSFLTHNVLVNVPIRKANCTESSSPTDIRLLTIQRFDWSNQSDTAQGNSSLMHPSSEQNLVSISNMSHQMLVTNKSTPPNQLVSSDGQNVSDNLQTVSADTYSMEEPPPKYQHYAVKNMRINSFQGWPAEHRQKPEEMAECGFYYAGFSDCVRCFHCGVGLRHWMSEDDPWIEHARWSTSCIYVLRMKGEEFVSLVKMAVEIAAREEAARSNSGGNQEPEHISETAPAVTAKEVASSNSSTVDSTPSKDVTASKGVTGGNATGAAASTPSSGNTEIHKYLLTDAAQSVLDMGYQPKLVQRAIERILLKQGTEELRGQLILEAVFEIEEETKVQPKPKQSAQSAEGHESIGKGAEATENASSEESQLDPEKIKREHRELREATLCKICMENTISVVFLPCGHLVTCPDCAPAMRKCPICRTLIKGTVKTFYG